MEEVIVPLVQGILRAVMKTGGNFIRAFKFASGAVRAVGKFLFPWATSAGAQAAANQVAVYQLLMAGIGVAGVITDIVILESMCNKKTFRRGDVQYAQLNVPRFLTLSQLVVPFVTILSIDDRGPGLVQYYWKLEKKGGYCQYTMVYFKEIDSTINSSNLIV